MAALPPSLLPAELEFISEETLIQIVPLFSMDPIRLLSVRPPSPSRFSFLSSPTDTRKTRVGWTAGHLRTLPTSETRRDPALDGRQPKDETKVPHPPSCLAVKRCVPFLPSNLPSTFFSPLLQLPNSRSVMGLG